MIKYKGYIIQKEEYGIYIVTEGSTETEGYSEGPFETILDARKRIDLEEIEEAVENGVSSAKLAAYKKSTDSVIERFMEAKPGSPRYRVYSDVINRTKYKATGPYLETRICLLHINELEEEVGKRKWTEGYEEGRRSAFREIEEKIKEK